MVISVEKVCSDVEPEVHLEEELQLQTVDFSGTKTTNLGIVVIVIVSADKNKLVSDRVGNCR